MAEDKKSIFKFQEKLGIESPFGDWKLSPRTDESTEASGLQVTKVEGPFNEEGKKVEFVSREHDYYYLATLNQKVSPALIKNVKWAVSYDAGKAKDSFYLFSAGHIEKNKVKVAVQISKGVDSFSIYAYTGKIPNDNVSAVAKFKKVVVFFIGGAGDKSKYMLQKATNIIFDEVQIPFLRKMDTGKKQDLKFIYLGFDEVWSYTEVVKNVFPEIGEKYGTAINIVGHSLGGWNGAHLARILHEFGYKVQVLVTLDPVGSGYFVGAFSSIYASEPAPKYQFWINVHASPDTRDNDDWVAWAGGRWIPETRPKLFSLDLNLHHREAGKMFSNVLWEGWSASSFLKFSINTELELP